MTGALILWKHKGDLGIHGDNGTVVRLMERIVRLFIPAFLLFGYALVFAGPAPWYRWQHPGESLFICAQLSPGDGWVPVQGPFQDSGCRKPGNL